MYKRLTTKEWTNIFRNLNELEPSEYYGGIDNEVEVLWLDPGDDSPGEWALCYGEELFEDGFKSEEDACNRLDDVAQDACDYMGVRCYPCGIN